MDIWHVAYVSVDLSSIGCQVILILGVRPLVEPIAEVTESKTEIRTLSTWFSKKLKKLRFALVHLRSKSLNGHTALAALISIC